MAGHSKWANIRHRKEKQDNRRGKVWTKCSKAIIVAARLGGPDPAANYRLRYAIDEARYANMPKDTIQRAIEKGAGAGQGDDFQELVYEGYGPGGSAIIVESLTDNGTRTVNDVRLIFKKYGGSMGTTGSVAYQFDTKGRIVIDCAGLTADAILEATINAGADDVQLPDDLREDGAAATILTALTDFAAVKAAVEAAGLTIREAQIARIAQNVVEVRGETARDVLALIEALEDHDDIQKVYSNIDIPADELAKLG